MKRKFIIFLILLFFIGVISSGVEEKEKVSFDVKEKVLNEGDEVRVFINLNGSDSEEVKNEIADLLGEDKVKFEFQDSISAIVNNADLEELETINEIESIEEVKVRKVFLQDSVPLVNATPTYSLQVNGINLTGKGQTICIIDSGVNYSHPDFGGCWGNNSVNSNCKIWGGRDYCADDASCTTEDDDPLDVLGHGTHVTGIAAANGSINGVAPESRIIVQKACNASGSCFDDAIKKGIDWCVNNASIYNISVISMSLGGGLFTNYCNNDPLVANINNAVGKNISVVIATGNDGSTSKIAAPACVQNATPAGSVRKDDTSIDYNRNSLVLLLAPGVSINSTYLTSLSSTGYTSLSGTSMATPHVSGAIALVRQFLNMTGQSKTPEQIEIILNNTGKLVDDSSGSGLNYSRVNVYNAIISLDINSPNVSLLSPANGLNSVNLNHSFSCNASDLALKNVTFYLWNSSGVYNTSSSSVSGGANNYKINISNLKLGSYHWNCQYYDQNGNSAFALSNFSFSINDLEVGLISPSNNLNTNQNHSFSCNASTNNYLTNMTFYLWNSSGLETSIFKNISGAVNSTTVSYNFSKEGAYSWNCFFENNLTNNNFAPSNYSLVYDITRPSINATSPLNNSWANSGRFNVSLNENGSCIYSLDFGVNNLSMSSKDNVNLNASNLTLPQGQGYNVSYYCNDSAGNLNSDLRSFNIDLIKPNVSLISPADGYSITASDISFNYNVSDNLNISQCDLILNSAIAASNSSGIGNGTNTISYSISAGSYNWGINCTDQAGNIGNSSLRSLTASAASSSVASSGGGGGGAVSGDVFEINKEQASQGYTKELNKNDKIKFEIFDEVGVLHILTVDFIGENFANLTIQSEPMHLVLGVGQSIKLNLTSADYYNLYVKLDSIVNRKAKLTIQTIHDLIIKKATEDKVEGEKKVEDEGKEIDMSNWIKEKEINYIVYVVIWLFVFALVVLIFFVLSIRDRKKIKKELIEIKERLRKRKEG